MMDLAAFAEKAHEYCRLTNATVVLSTTSRRWAELHRRPFDTLHLDGLAVDVVYDQPLSAEQRGHLAALVGLRLRIEDDHDHLEAPPSP